jgi:hypothetical protein
MSQNIDITDFELDIAAEPGGWLARFTFLSFMPNLR